MLKVFSLVIVAVTMFIFLCTIDVKGEEEIVFTEEELALIEESKNGDSISMGIIPGTFPMSDFNENTGDFTGITVELLNLISEKTGLKFQYEPINLVEYAPIASLKAGKTDLVAGILKTQDFQSDSQLILSERLVNCSVVFVGRKGELYIDEQGTGSVAIIKGFQVGIEYLQNNFPNYIIVTYDTSEACLDAVASGEADFNLNVKYIASYLLQNPHYENLERTAAFSFNMDTCVAGISGKSETIISIIDKGLNSITEDEYNYILMDFTIGNIYEMTFSDFIYKYRATIILMCFMLLIIVICIVLIFKIRSRNIKRIKKSNEQLKEALNIAQRANEAKSLFTSRMSHEIRTPLNAVIGYITIANNNIENSEKVKYCLNKSEVAARHLLGIINDVLDFSSIESGKIKITNEIFDVKGIISIISAMFYPQAKEKDIEFNISIESLTYEELIGDGMRFNQILVNLISNAIKFTPKGGKVDLIISQSLIKEDKIYLNIKVRDTGIGINKDFKEKIFSPFEQQDSSITKTFGGTGLGLSITKSLVGLMGGTISLESIEDRGTVFEVELPFGRVFEISENKKEKTKENNEKPNFKGFKVLLVEDNAMNMEIATEILKSSGLKVDGAYNGKEAFEMFEISKPGTYGLVFMDVQMPVMSGYEATRKIRASKHADAISIPIIAMSAYAFSEDISEALASGMTGYIAKPIDVKELFEVVRKYLK